MSFNCFPSMSLALNSVTFLAHCLTSSSKPPVEISHPSISKCSPEIRLNNSRKICIFPQNFVQSLIFTGRDHSLHSQTMNLDWRMSPTSRSQFTKISTSNVRIRTFLRMTARGKLQFNNRSTSNSNDFPVFSFIVFTVIPLR